MSGVRVGRSRSGLGLGVGILLVVDELKWAFAARNIKRNGLMWWLFYMMRLVGDVGDALGVRSETR